MIVELFARLVPCKHFMNNLIEKIWKYFCTPRMQCYHIAPVARMSRVPPQCSLTDQRTNLPRWALEPGCRRISWRLTGIWSLERDWSGSWRWRWRRSASVEWREPIHSKWCNYEVMKILIQRIGRHNHPIYSSVNQTITYSEFMTRMNVNHYSVEPVQRHRQQ